MPENMPVTTCKTLYGYLRSLLKERTTAYNLSGSLKLDLPRVTISYNLLWTTIVFTVMQQKEKIGNHPVEEAKEMKCYKRLIFKQFLQVSGLCGLQFLSYLLKRFTHLCKALYGDVMLVHSFGARIWPPKINKNIWSTHFL